MQGFLLLCKKMSQNIDTPTVSGGGVSRFCVYGYAFVFSALPPSYRPSTPCFFILPQITVKVKKTLLLTDVEVDADILANFVGTKLLTD